MLLVNRRIDLGATESSLPIDDHETDTSFLDLKHRDD